MYQELKRRSSALESAEAAIRAREVFQREYAAKGDYEFVSVPINSLLAPQWQADLQYVDELAQRLATDGRQEDDFDFAFPQGSIAEPMTSGNTLLFTSRSNAHRHFHLFRPTALAMGEYDIVLASGASPELCPGNQTGWDASFSQTVHTRCLRCERHDVHKCTHSCAAWHVKRSLAWISGPAFSLRSRTFRLPARRWCVTSLAVPQSRFHACGAPRKTSSE